jgi:hypothetical protein
VKQVPSDHAVASSGLRNQISNPFHVSQISRYANRKAADDAFYPDVALSKENGCGCNYRNRYKGLIPYHETQQHGYQHKHDVRSKPSKDSRDSTMNVLKSVGSANMYKNESIRSERVKREVIKSHYLSSKKLN